jgi:hypothetical protein
MMLQALRNGWCDVGEIVKKGVVPTVARIALNKDEHGNSLGFNAREQLRASEIMAKLREMSVAEYRLFRDDPLADGGGRRIIHTPLPGPDEEKPNAEADCSEGPGSEG